MKNNFAIMIPMTAFKMEEPKTYSTIDGLMNDLPEDKRYRYCTANRCACMGCVNNDLARCGFSKKDWENWVSEHPDTRPKEVGFSFESRVFPAYKLDDTV